nr:hypothetical protein [Tanacetum cinerariifolium]
LTADGLEALTLGGEMLGLGEGCRMKGLLRGDVDLDTTYGAMLGRVLEKFGLTALIVLAAAISIGYYCLVCHIDAAHYITYALTVNPTIYVSCIKLVWRTIAVKSSNDVTRLQALVDKKKVVVTEATIRDALHLDDAEGVDCLPNEEIFATLARMGYEKPSIKLTFYKAFFSSLWKFLIHTILQSMSAKRTSWNEFSSAMASAVICLATAREPKNQGHAEEQGDGNNAAEESVTAIDDRIESSDDTHIEDISNQGRMIDESEKDQGAKLMTKKETKEEVVEVVTTTKLITEVVAAVSETGKGILVEESKPIKKKQQVELDEAYARKLQEEFNQDINWETAIDHVKQRAKKEPFIQRYQVIKKRPQTEAQARQNMMMYQKNTVGFTLDFFKGMSYDDICPIFKAKFNANLEFLLKTKEKIEEEESKEIALINESSAQKAAKRRRMNKEAEDVEELKQHLEIVPDEDEDVYTEATPLARKVPVVDYQIIHTMFGRPDGQDNVWKDQRSVHGQALVKSWKLLTSCGVHIITFTTTHIILLVERRYPLLKFTLEQMINVVRLQVEEQSEMSLKFIRFTRQQL